MSQIAQMPKDAHEETSPSAIFGVFGAVWRHKWLLLLGLVFGVAIGSIYSSQLLPEYQSSLKLLVVKKRPDLPLAAGADSRYAYMEDYLATHQVVIRSPIVITKAVDKGNLQALSSFANGKDATAEIMRSLSISREATESGATNILTLSYRSQFSDDCAVVLKAVVDSYSDFLGDTYRNVSTDTFKLITDVKDQLEKGITKKEAEYRKFRLEHPILLKGKDGLNVRQDRLFNIETKRSALLLRKVEIDDRLVFLENVFKTEKDRSKILALVAQSEASQLGSKNDTVDTNSVAYQEQMLQTLLDDFGPDHPQVQATRKRIERAGKLLPTDGRKGDPIQAHLQSLMRELDNIKASEQALVKLFQTEQVEAQKQIANEMQDEAFQKDIAREQQLFEGILKRLQEMNLLKDLGGYDAKVITPAGPGGKIGTRTVNIFVMAVLMGLAGGMGLAYLAEISDQSFRSPDDIRRLLHLRIVGQIPTLLKKGPVAIKVASPDKPIIAPILLAYHLPKSREAEAYRGVRTALFFSTQGKGHKVIQITSPAAADGKSTLAANLAICIAQAEKKVLLVDADFRKPTLHKLFNNSAERGLASVLNGDAKVAEVIQSSGVEGLSILPCGPTPANPAELLSLPQFKELLESFRENYDFVVIDSPPLLAVTDPCMVAPYADGVMLTIRLSKNAKPAAQRAKEILATLGANVIGVVVNAVSERGDKYGYGYGSYGYAYGYGYGYGKEPGYGLEGTKENKGVTWYGEY